MNDTTPDAPESGPESDEKGGESRRARSIRFSDSEWETVEKAAAQRGMSAAELARHAALGVASGQYGARTGRLTSAIRRTDRAHFPQHPHPGDAETR